MKIYPSALSTLLGASALSSSHAFLHTPPRTYTLSTQTDRRMQRQRTTTSSTLSSPSLSSQVASSSIVTRLAIYPSDQPLSERLKNVQSEWDNVSKQGLGKFFSDELEAAERIIRGNADRATGNADDVLKNGEDDYLLKEGFHNMAETGKRLASEIWEIKQEVDEVKAAKIIEEAAEDVVGTDVMVEKDLEKVVQGVVSSLEEAEEVVQSAIATVASKEGLTDATRAALTEKLEDKAKNIEESIKVADSVAKTAKQISIEDAKVLSELEKTGDRLSSAIDATESLTEQLKGTEGGAAVDAVSSTVDAAAAIVKEDLSAAESIADAVGQKVVMEADAVMAMDDKAADSVRSVRAAKDSIQESSGESGESLAEALAKDAQDIQVDANTAGKLAKAIEEDAANDEEALGALERSGSEVNDLINAVDGAVGKAADAVEGEASAGSVTEAVNRIEDEVKNVEETITSAKEAVEECEDCHVKKVAEEMEAGKGDKSESAVEASSAKVEEAKAEEAKVEAQEAKGEEIKVPEEDGSATATKIETKANEPEVKVESSQGAEQVSSANNMQSSEGMGEPIGEKAHEAIATASADTTSDVGKEGLGNAEVSEATTLASVDHGSERLTDATTSAAHATNHASDSVTDAVDLATNSISVGEMADAVASAEPTESLGTVVASVAGVVTDVSESISSTSDAAHDVATSTTEALAEAVAVVSSLFL